MPVVTYIGTLFISWLNDAPLHSYAFEWITCSWMDSIYQLMDICLFHLLIAKNNVALKFVYKLFCKHVCSLSYI
jgi:hypothetical protein